MTRQDREFMFLTNTTELTALHYKHRWQIEMCFKWLKLHLKIKEFRGTTTGNAVRIQTYSAICTNCMVAIVQHDMRLTESTYEVLQILSMSLTDTMTKLYSKMTKNQAVQVNTICF